MFVRIRRCLLYVLLTILICAALYSALWICIASTALGRTYDASVTTTSQDGKYQLALKEYTCLGPSGAEVWLNNKKIGDLLFDDYNTPIAAKAYKIEWQDEELIIQYFSGIGTEKRDDSCTWRTFQYKLDGTSSSGGEER